MMDAILKRHGIGHVYRVNHPTLYLILDITSTASCPYSLINEMITDLIPKRSLIENRVGNQDSLFLNVYFQKRFDANC